VQGAAYTQSSILHPYQYFSQTWCVRVGKHLVLEHSAGYFVGFLMATVRETQLKTSPSVGECVGSTVALAMLVWPWLDRGGKLVALLESVDYQ